MYFHVRRNFARLPISQKRKKKSLEFDRNIRLLHLPLMSCGQHKIGGITFTETHMVYIHIKRKARGRINIYLCAMNMSTYILLGKVLSFNVCICLCVDVH